MKKFVAGLIGCTFFCTEHPSWWKVQQDLKARYFVIFWVVITQQCCTTFVWNSFHSQHSYLQSEDLLVQLFLTEGLVLGWSANLWGFQNFWEQIRDIQDFRQPVSPACNSFCQPMAESCFILLTISFQVVTKVAHSKQKSNLTFKP